MFEHDLDDDITETQPHSITGDVPIANAVFYSVGLNPFFECIVIAPPPAAVEQLEAWEEFVPCHA